MSFILKRSLSTLIPPKIASPANLGSNPNAKRMQSLVTFYSKLPRGQAIVAKPSTPWGAYKAKYRASGAPVLHLTLSLMLLGYSLDYYFEFSHEKDEE